MSFVHSLSDRIGPRSPTDENSLGQGFISNFQQPMNDTRASLQRRFTTDNSNKMSPFSPLVQQPQMPEQIDISSSVSYVALLHGFHRIQVNGPVVLSVNDFSRIEPRVTSTSANASIFRLSSYIKPNSCVTTPALTTKFTLLPS